MKKFFLFAVLLLSLCGYANNDIPKWKDSKPIKALPQTEYDIFNLRWGMKKDECYRICDWGGKFERKVERPVGFRLLRFSFCKEYILVGLDFDNDNLYGATFIRDYPNDIDNFKLALPWFGYLNYLLYLRGYKYTYNGLEDTNYSQLSDESRYASFLSGKIDFRFELENSRTKIKLSLLKINSKKIVIMMTYKNKNHKYSLSNEEKLDSRGL